MFLIIFADDLGYGDICYYRATKLKTPNIDRHANEGVRFMNAYAPSSTCSQSRYGLECVYYARTTISLLLEYI